MLFHKQISIKPHQVGYLYVKNRFRRRLEPGVYYFWNWTNEINVAYLPAQSRLCTVTNQEVLTRNAIARKAEFRTAWITGTNEVSKVHLGLAVE
ncbi:hypothetical protein OsccyDRAFT_3972 [Leptolyngbyaceae cyanobacterium JSC-12]|nr:hypothetical protein OsccyDRAFT_3972 [Leptolyngbyaceae cyanobacterium JSC-12]